MQITDTVLMIRPASFAFNEETAATNSFQNRTTDHSYQLQQKVLAEFDAMVGKLQGCGIKVVVFDDTPSPAKPDAIFPNNWISAAQKSISVFPMQAKSRRAERRSDIVQWISDQYHVERVCDWSQKELNNEFLEGTGSMVMDHSNRIIYACLSPRTSRPLLEEFAAAYNYGLLAFHAVDEKLKPIYHTNVMLAIGEAFAVVCADSITDERERMAVTKNLQNGGREIIQISSQQMNAFAGNLLQLKNPKCEKIIVLSKTAFGVLTEEQRASLASHGELLPIDVTTIEQVEGGSVRCMMAEILLPAKLH
jgi:hypothetical protein